MILKVIENGRQQTYVRWLLNISKFIYNDAESRFKYYMDLKQSAIYVEKNLIVHMKIFIKLEIIVITQSHKEVM